MRAAIYSRFSSENQSASSLADQIEVCSRYITKSGWTAVTTYSDAAMSGASRFRPGYQQLLADLDCGVFDVVVVEALDRLGRKLHEGHQDTPPRGCVGGWLRREGPRAYTRRARRGGRNWCSIFYSAEARRTRSQFIGDS